MKFNSAAAVAFGETILKSYVTPLDLRDEEFTDDGLVKVIEELSMYHR